MSPASVIVRKFNPGVLQSDDEVVAQFVVRQREFGILMGVLRDNIASSPCQHMLVVAPRGRGKTMMLARVAAELRANEELRREFLPVRFMEESYEVFDLADFWLDVLLYLAPEVTRHDAELADLLRQAHAEFSGRSRGQEVEESARTVALETAQRLGRKLVLMVENCQALFEDVDDRFGWGLRKTLQTEPNVMFLGTATVRMAALTDVEAPFYEFFRTMLLAPLPLRECKVLWEAVSGEARSEREIRPLQILTGGDPRLLAIVAGLAHHRSLRELLQELVALIDDHTEYFRSHLEHLGKTERRVYVALVDLWRPSTTAEIATRARQEIRVTSSLLGRLVKRGAISYEGKGQKRLYQATQPLYSIYYKLRRQRDEAAVVHGLVHWMVACFSAEGPKELQWAEWTRARALLIQGERQAALEALAVAYNNTTIDEETPGRLLHHIPELIGCGLAAKDLLEIFTKDPTKSAAMAPMIALLRLRNHEQVRVPVEVLAIAQDLAKLLDQSIARVQARIHPPNAGEPPSHLQ